MMVKTFKGGGLGGNTGGAIDYLAGKQVNDQPMAVNRPGAKLLSGDLDVTQEWINQASDRFKRCYTAGVLSFEESEIDDDIKHEIMRSFEEALLPGLEKSEYNIVWIEHQDKERIELNWVVPRIHTETGAHLQPYFHDIDQPRILSWQEWINAEHQLSSPQAPEKARTLSMAKDSPQKVNDVKNALDEYMATIQPRSREEVVEALNAIDGIEVKRQVKTSISVAVDGHQRNIRLTGAYYHEDFKADRGAGTRIRDAQSRFDATSDVRARERKADYERQHRQASERNRAKYDRLKKSIAQREKTDVDVRLGGALVDVYHERVDGIGSVPDTQRPEQPRAQDGVALESQRNSTTKSDETAKKIEAIFDDNRRSNQADANRVAKGQSANAERNRQSTASNQTIIERSRERATELKNVIGSFIQKVTRMTRGFTR